MNSIFKARKKYHKNLIGLIILTVILLWPAASIASPLSKQSRLHYTVSMEQPNRHYFHVVLEWEGIPGRTIEFKMPSWTPGYYRIMDYAANVTNFQAKSGAGQPLYWEKTAKNIWKVDKGKEGRVIISYDVYGFQRFVATSYLADDCAFITPASVFMHPKGRLKDQVTVEVKPPSGWTNIATGLDPEPGRENIFRARDFDTLYDSPILAGKLDTFEFEVKNIPHRVAAVDLSGIDREKLKADLKRIVESSVSIIGDLPYSHYVFLLIGEGRGGLEHLNSCALTYSSAMMANPQSYKSWLAFVAHEFFHLYNVKAIRPLALGPFDYDKENYTRMLWVSEGLTVYYEYLILNRAGLMSREEVLAELGKIITRYETSPGRKIQSAASSSFDTWLHFFSRGEHNINTTVSYYDAGAVLGLLLDLKIRHESKGRTSLDDVMRTLYYEFFKEKKRGFTDAEFRTACQKAAGVSLEEIFVDYAEKAKDINYENYLSYAGLELRREDGSAAKGYLGAIIEDKEGSPVIARIDWHSPASEAGLSTQDEIISLNDVRVTARTFNDRLANFKPGERVKILYSRRNKICETEVTLGSRAEKRFKLKQASDLTERQKTLLDRWLK